MRAGGLACPGAEWEMQLGQRPVGQLPRGSKLLAADQARQRCRRCSRDRRLRRRQAARRRLRGRRAVRQRRIAAAARATGAKAAWCLLHRWPCATTRCTISCPRKRATKVLAGPLSAAWPGVGVDAVGAERPVVEAVADRDTVGRAVPAAPRLSFTQEIAGSSPAGGTREAAANLGVSPVAQARPGERWPPGNCAGQRSAGRPRTRHSRDVSPALTEIHAADEPKVEQPRLARRHDSPVRGPLPSGNRICVSVWARIEG